MAHPERCPGPVVEQTLSRTARRVVSERVRPWLQAFSLQVAYGPVELAAQIRAAEAAGTAGWFLWNPRGLYPDLEAAMGVAGEKAVADGYWSSGSRWACR